MHHTMLFRLVPFNNCWLMFGTSISMCVYLKCVNHFHCTGWLLVHHWPEEGWGYYILFLPFLLSSSHQFCFSPSYSSDPVSPLEIITLSSGNSIHPVPIEMRIKDEIPFICDVMVVGDEKQFLTCLMTLTLRVYLHHFYTYIIKIKNSNPSGKRKGGNEARPT